MRNFDLSNARRDAELNRKAMAFGLLVAAPLVGTAVALFVMAFWS